jgi:hypothetical protein
MYPLAPVRRISRLLEGEEGIVGATRLQHSRAAEPVRSRVLGGFREVTPGKS